MEHVVVVVVQLYTYFYSVSLPPGSKLVGEHLDGSNVLCRSFGRCFCGSTAVPFPFNVIGVLVLPS